MTTAQQLIELVWHNQKCPDWDGTNHSMSYALRLAIGAHLKFDVAAFEAIDAMRSSYWMGEHGWEPRYALAIVVENKSFIEAFEEWTGRKPFRANHVNFGFNGSDGFRHRTTFRTRERLALGFTVGHDRAEVTSISNERVVLTTRKIGGRTIQKLTHEQLAELYPAPKKSKAQKEEE